VRYIQEPEFRLQSELEACAAQVKYVRDLVKEEPEGAKVIEYCLSESAKTLSSPLYGGLLSENEARCKIRNLARSSAS
jgi:hypothetical protein